MMSASGSCLIFDMKRSKSFSKVSSGKPKPDCFILPTAKMVLDRCCTFFPLCDMITPTSSSSRDASISKSVEWLSAIMLLPSRTWLTVVGSTDAKLLAKMSNRLRNISRGRVCRMSPSAFTTFPTPSWSPCADSQERKCATSFSTVALSILKPMLLAPISTIVTALGPCRALASDRFRTRVSSRFLTRSLGTRCCITPRAQIEFEIACVVSAPW
mmetsp:Transcript_4209/g.10832  ORF Transcript_4209/g.10832 Transcript_4209/m.10832 type:complete len:214 (-) Transcript_4209:111-752(-)